MQVAIWQALRCATLTTESGPCHKAFVYSTTRKRLFQSDRSDMVTWYDYDQQISGCTMHHPRPRDPLDHPRPVELLSVAQAPKEPEPPPAKTSGIWSKILEPQWLRMTLQSLRTMVDNDGQYISPNTTDLEPKNHLGDPKVFKRLEK
jgi:hypothetical protein